MTPTELPNWYLLEKAKREKTFSCGYNTAKKHPIASKALLKLALEDPNPNEFTEGWIASCRKSLKIQKNFIPLPYEYGPDTGCAHKISDNTHDGEPVCEKCGMPFFSYL